MDATTTIVGAILACVGVLSGSVVAFLGKRSETGLARFNSVTDQVQEDNATLREHLANREAKIDVLTEQRLRDVEQITKLRVKVINLGGDPD